MNKLQVNTASKSYPILFTESFAGLSDAIKDCGKEYSSYIIITDTNVGPLYGDQVKKVLETFKKPVLVCNFEAGENSKHLETIQSFFENMIELGADRKSLVVALGGGVAGDMAGFTASIYMRGLDFVQVPTSLLSQVDSSVGGKTGVDFLGYKNLIGAFYQPEFVYINVSTLKTLPERELIAGMGEVIKHGVIRDKTYFAYLQDHVSHILNLDSETMMDTIRWSCEIKKNVVDQDEKEHGLRGLLNFGHTFGHSIERLKEFELIHGECVGIGMHGELVLAEKLGLVTSQEVSTVLELIKAYKLPITIQGLQAESIYQDMFKDKKTTDKRLVFAMIDSIGTSHLSKEAIDKSVIIESIEEIME